MNPAVPKTLGETIQEVRASTLEAALVAAGGSITRAADALGIHRVTAAKLTKRFNLSTRAKQLRKESGLPAVGRPRGSSKKQKL